MSAPMYASAPVPARRIVIVLALVLAAVVTACGAPEPAQRPAEDVARLEAVIPVLEDLGAADFEDSPYCRALGYRRGQFGILDEAGCERPGTVAFDEVAAADHARIAGAMEGSGVQVLRVRSTFGPDGTLETATFMLLDSSVERDWAYLFDPRNVVAKADGAAEYTQLGGAWWLVASRDD